MKRLLLALILAATAVGTLAADEWVSGYLRNNGTYVSGYWRSDRDNSFWNNYSSWGNTNPHTGARGYELPSCTEYTSNPSYYSYTYRPAEYYSKTILSSYSYTTPEISTTLDSELDKYIRRYSHRRQ